MSEEIVQGVDDAKVGTESMSEIIERLQSRQSGRGVREVEFLCLQCDSLDKGRFFLNEPTPLVINCYHCKAGRGLSIEQQIQQRKGMFPAAEPEKAVTEGGN